MITGPHAKERQVGSGVLHLLGRASSQAAAGVTVAAVVAAWAVVGVVEGFPSWWATILYSVSSSLTLVMVFAIQHTQARQQAATQRKLDELLRAQPEAHNRLIAVEQAPDEELRSLADQDLADHREADPVHR